MTAAAKKRGAHRDAATSMQIQVGIITISDRASAGEYEDLGGPALKQVAQKIGDHAPVGAVFHNRRFTGEIIKPNAPGRDPVITRIIWLRGLQASNAHANYLDHKTRVCTRCGGAMTVARITPRFGSLPELITFKCQACGEISTVVETKSSIVTVPLLISKRGY